MSDWTMKQGWAATLVLLTAWGLSGCSSESTSTTDGEETMEPAAEWVDLLAGSGLETHWRGYNMDGVPEGWSLEDGVLSFEPLEEGRSGDLMTRETYSDFELELEYRISEGGNSGILHHGIEQEGLAFHWSAPEFQLLDNPAYSDGGPAGLTASLYALIPAEPQNTRPAGEWNSVTIRSEGPDVEYWQNGEKVVEYERWTPEWFERIRGTKFEDYPSFGTIPEGHIGFQDHGNAVWFRNIRIRSLDS
ncbi:MAG: 3-keto-disaccharide hydrolase [Bacteroidota bacterium]